MGRPSSKTKQKKRMRQKGIKAQSQFSHSADSIHNDPSDSASHYNSQSQLDSSGDSHDSQNSYTPCDSLVNIGHHSSVPSGGLPNSAYVTEIGDQDLELLEMRIYDSYRQEDGAPNSYKYLLDCRKKLMTKLHSFKKQVGDTSITQRGD